MQFAWGTADGNPPAVIPIGEQFLVRARWWPAGMPNRGLAEHLDRFQEQPADLMTYQEAMSSGKEVVYEKTIEPEGEAERFVRSRPATIRSRNR